MKPLKILLADDSKTARHSLRGYLDSWGFEIAEAVDGDDAWKILCEPDPPRIAIIDWLMPGADGLELCRRLNQRDGQPLIYTILLTVKRDEEDLIEALEAGAHSFLSKPVSPAALRSYVNVGRRMVQADDRLNQSEKLLRMVQESVSEGILIYDNKYKIVSANQSFQKMFNLSPDEFSNFHFSALYEDAAAQRNDEVLQRILSGREFQVEWNRKRASVEAPETVAVYFKGLVIDGRNLVLCVVRDVTRQRHEEQQRMQSEKLKAAMETAGAACHELNQPLQAVITGLDMGIMQTEDGSDANIRLRAIRKASLRMAEITHKLQGITDYQTKQYVGDKNILDLDRSSG